MRKSKLYNFTPQQLQELLDSNGTYTSILREVGISTTSSTNTLKRIIDEYGLDTTKFESNRKIFKQQAVKSCLSRVYDIESKLKKDTKVQSHKLKNKLIEFGYKESKCELCGISEWMGKPVKLQLHHIDGDHDNNELSNLQILCPNCHAMTDNFGVYNSKRVKKPVPVCKECGVKISNYSKSGLCVSCSHKNKQLNQSGKVICPQCQKNLMLSTSTVCEACYYQNKRERLNRIIPRSELKELIRTTPFTGIADMYGVTDNAVRKWCDAYKLPRKSSDIKTYSDEEWELL